MKICKDGLCPVDNIAKCCIFCDKKATCKDACEYANNEDCENIQDIESGLTAFESKEVAEKYSKISNVKASIKIVVKD